MAALLDESSDFALVKSDKPSEFKLIVEQKSVIEAGVCSKREVLGVLPTRFGKSLIFHMLSDRFHFVDAKGQPVKAKQSPLSSRRLMP